MLLFFDWCHLHTCCFLSPSGYDVFITVCYYYVYLLVNCFLFYCCCWSFLTLFNIILIIFIWLFVSDYLVIIIGHYLHIHNCFWLSCYYCLVDVMFLSLLFLCHYYCLLLACLSSCYLLLIILFLWVVYYIIWYVSYHRHMIIRFWLSRC